MEALWRVDRFGAQAVFGRQLTVAEMRRLAQAETIYLAYKQKWAAKSLTVWTHNNSALAALLEKARRAMEDEDRNA